MQGVVPGVQSVKVQIPIIQSVIPGVQSIVPVQSMVLGVQSIVPQVVPQATSYVQPIGSRHPIEQNHIGLADTPSGFANVGGSPYGKISTGIPVTSYVEVQG